MYKRLIRFLFFLGIALLVLGGSRQVRAEAPTNVGLLYFTATPQTDGIRLDWKTESELGTAGFIIKRAVGSSTTFVTLDNIGFVASQGGVATGATYSRVDETAVYGQSYSYKLVEIETDSSETDLETVVVTFIIEPTATPVVIGGGNPTTTAPTNTPVPTSTSRPSATPTGTAVPPTLPSSAPTQGTHTNTPLPSGVTPSPTAPEAAPTTATATPQDQPDTSPPLPTPDGIVAFAQETNPTPYPGPVTPAAESNNEPYPAAQPLENSVEPTPHPTTIDADVLPTVAVIGSQVEDTQPENSAQPATPEGAVRGRVFLWMGFLIALFIFITGVVGAIVLYRRRRE